MILEWEQSSKKCKTITNVPFIFILSNTKRLHCSSTYMYLDNVVKTTWFIYRHNIPSVLIRINVYSLESGCALAGIAWLSTIRYLWMSTLCLEQRRLILWTSQWWIAASIETRIQSGNHRWRFICLFMDKVNTNVRF